MVVDVVQQIAALDQARAVANAMGAALVERLVNRVRSERFARVRGTVDVVVDDELSKMPISLFYLVMNVNE
jgi:hypothetical protein